MNTFLTVKEDVVKNGELSGRAFADYHKCCEWLLKSLVKHRRVDDLRPEDFAALRSAIANGRGPVTIRNEINRIRVVMKFAYDHRLIDRPVHYGQSFNRPSAKTLRRARNAAGPRLFEREELQRILDFLDGQPVTVEGEDKPITRKPSPVLKAMVLLGLNCGFGNTDVATLPQSAVDLSGGWIDFPRPKTEIPRRIPLWPETTAALAQAIRLRPEPADPQVDDRCFLTRNGHAFVRTQDRKGEGPSDRQIPLDPLGQRFILLLKRLKIDDRKGRGFYTLRHVFETIGGESKDQVAVNAIMGHVDNTMAGVYRERISDERLREVTDTVRRWLFGVEASRKASA